MNKLNPEEYSLAGEVLGELDIHLAVQALLDGDSPGEIYLDNKDDPQSALAWTMNRFFLAGPSDNVDMIWTVKELFDKEIFPDGLDQGREGFTIFYTPEEWGSVIAEVILNGKYPIHDQRHYYRCRKLKRDWRDLMPQGYSLLEVDENLVESQRMENLEELIEEIHSECQSVPAFLENRFGYCMVHEDQLVT
ncbi:MAG: GNAT family N-acetyltransferase, partial [Anaerolineales bacterium]